MGDVLGIVARGLGVQKRIPPGASTIDSGRGWYPLIRESFTGAWQRNIAVSLDTATNNTTLFRVITLIASDVAKLRPRLVLRGADGIWTETESPAFSPVLRKPNRYQTRQQFFENWQTSKLLHGNTYVLKERDKRGVVVALYVLDPNRVKPLVAPDGQVYYQLQDDNLAGLQANVVPAREIIHDRMAALFHPLVGQSPIYACGLAAVHGNEIQRTSALFFRNGATPGGVLTHPDEISDELARQYKERWEANYSGQNAGRVAVIGNGLTYQPLGQNAVDSQLVEQLKASDERICSAFGVPAYMAGVGPAPLNNNVEASAQQYFAQCLQALIEAAEACLDEGLSLPSDLGVEFDLDGLLRMDQATQAKALAEVVGAGIMAPNEARKRLGLKPVKGGDSPMMQQQDFSLAALAERDAAKPFTTPAAPPPSAPAAAPEAGSADERSLTEKVRPVLESIAAELADRAERREAGLLKRIASLENASAATRAQVNQVVKAALPKGSAPR